MSQEDFHKQFEEESDNIFEELIQFSEEDLLKIISDRVETRFRIWSGNDNYQIWKVLQTKGTTRSIQPLFGIVSDLSNNYLIRYHACNALFQIAKLNDDNLKSSVQYGLDSERKPVNQRSAIQKLQEILNMGLL